MEKQNILSPSFSELLAYVDAREARFAEAIGRFTMRFAELEGKLNWATSKLLGTTQDRGRIAMAAIRNVSTRLDIFAALVAGVKMDEAVRARLKECAEQIGELNTYRNNLIHNQWGGMTTGDLERWNKVWTETSRRQSRRRQASFTATEILDKAQECLLCHVRIMDAMKAHDTGGPLEQP